MEIVLTVDCRQRHIVVADECQKVAGGAGDYKSSATKEQIRRTEEWLAGYLKMSVVVGKSIRSL